MTDHREYAGDLQIVRILLRAIEANRTHRLNAFKADLERLQHDMEVHGASADLAGFLRNTPGLLNETAEVVADEILSFTAKEVAKLSALKDKRELTAKEKDLLCRFLELLDGLEQITKRPAADIT